MRYNSVGVVFTFILLALASHRLQRIITTDHWPPTQWLRDKVDERFGAESGWAKYINCPWCLGTHATIVVFTIAAQLISIPLPVLQCAAAATIVGMLGVYDD